MKTKNLEQRITAFRRHPRLQPIWTGAAWAVLLFACVHVSVETPDLIAVPLDFLRSWLLLLPIPLLLGALAGGLGQVRCRGNCRGRAAVLGIAGIVGFYCGVLLAIVLAHFWLQIELEHPLALIAGAFLIAATVELTLAALIIGAANVLQRVRAWR